MSPRPLRPSDYNRPRPSARRDTLPPSVHGARCVLADGEIVVTIPHGTSPAQIRKLTDKGFRLRGGAWRCPFSADALAAAERVAGSPITPTPPSAA